MREERVAENESLFRSVNESLAVDTAARDAETGRHEFLCECWNEDCLQRMQLTRGEYESVRAEPTQFVVVHGHVDAGVEDVVLRTDRYAIVRKRGTAAEVAEELDPRS